MIIMLIFILALIITICASKYSSLGAISALVSIISGFVLFLGGALYLGNKAEIVEIKSVQQTLDMARKKGNSIENAAIQLEIINTNKKITSLKYYNKIFIFKDFIPDEVNNINLIE